MSDVRRWLEAIGLAQYADAFEANDLDMDLLASVDDQTPMDIGVSSAGHRLRIRSAIAKLAQMSTVDTKADSVGVPTGTSAATAERRQLAVITGWTREASWQAMLAGISLLQHRFIAGEVAD